MIEGLDEWEKEIADERTKQFNDPEFQRKYQERRRKDAEKVGGVMTQEELEAEEKEEDSEE